MTAPVTPATEPEANAVRTLTSALRARHQAMVARSMAGEPVPDEACRQLMADVVAAGASVPPGQERDRLRKILYHWAAVIGARGDLSSEVPTLASYAAETVPAVEASEAPPAMAAAAPVDAAEAVPSPPTEPAPPPPASVFDQLRRARLGQAVARSVEVLGQRPGGNPTRIARSPGGSDFVRIVESVQAVAAAPPVSAGLAGAAQIVGQVFKRLTASMAGPAPAPEPPPAAPASPGMEDVEALARTRAVIRIGALARQWLASPADSRAGYLLTGKALTEASLYVDDDPDIGTFVEASRAEAERVQRRQRGRSYVALFVLGAVVALCCGLVWYFYDQKRKAAERQDAEVERSQLLAANSASLAERVRIERDARRAVEALDRNDLGPLKALLGRIAEPDPGDLDRLILGPAKPASSGAEETKAPAKLPARGASLATAVPLPAVPAGTCDGFLWFGGPQDSRLADRGDPSRLTVGQQVTLDRRRDIRLRADRPSDNYDLGAIAGLVPAGSTVTIASMPLRYDRPSGQQYWAKVKVPRQFCTTVYVQYQGSDSTRDLLLAALRDAGVQTPPAQLIPNAAGRAEIRFFWPEDQAIADQIAAALAPFAKGAKLQVVSLTNFPRKPSIGTLEVWIDLNR